MKNLKLDTLEDWYSISLSKFKDNGGGIILEYYPNLVSALSSIYPNYNWSFQSKDYKMPLKYWQDINNVISFMKSIEHHYQIKTPEDWYRISIPQITKLGGRGILAKYKLSNILSKLYPSYQWDKEKLKTKNKRSKQRWLTLSIQKLFPSIEVIEEFSLPNTRNSGIPVELDIFIPQLNLALEYQGEHHYFDIPAFGSLELYKYRDNEKSNICKELGINLVPIPYWWDESISHLKEFISSYHPSLLHQIHLHQKE